MIGPLAHALAAALLVLVTACAGDGDDGGRDAAVVVPDSGADSGLPPCCPLDLAPEDPCGCQRTGGPTPADGVCPTVCGAHPLDLQTIFGGECAYLQQNGNRQCEVPDAG